MLSQSYIMHFKCFFLPLFLLLFLVFFRMCLVIVIAVVAAAGSVVFYFLLQGCSMGPLLSFLYLFHHHLKFPKCKMSRR